MFFKKLILILIAVSIVFLFIFNLYQWLKPLEVVISTPEEISQKDSPEEKITQEILEELSSPQVYLSSNSPEQGDTLLIKIKEKTETSKPKGEFESKEIDFLKPLADKGWISIIGIDVRKEPGKYNLVIDFSENRKFEKEITIIERNFPEGKFTVTELLKEKGYTQPKIIEDIISKEQPLLKQVFSIYTPQSYFNQSFIYPLKEIKLVGGFGIIRKNENLAVRHLGVDLDGLTGTPVYAVNNGVIRLSENLPNCGNTLIIDHGLGIFSLYCHLDEFKVLKGKQVKQGEVVALVGSTGYSLAPHLHFSIKINGASVDPLRFIEIIEKEMK